MTPREVRKLKRELRQAFEKVLDQHDSLFRDLRHDDAVTALLRVLYFQNTSAEDEAFVDDYVRKNHAMPDYRDYLSQRRTS